MLEKGILRKVRHKTRALIDVYPVLYLLLRRLRPRTRRLAVERDTELVIEGFLRSANTFAVAAFGFAQQRDVEIAHHMHAPAQVIPAVRMGIPTLVLIRHPKDAVLSLVIREPHISVEQASKDYIRFGCITEFLRAASASIGGQVAGADRPVAHSNLTLFSGGR